MSKVLLHRDDFREGVFKRDRNSCVVCGKPAVDAHHLIERKLFPDGGYYLDNGVSLCETHHLDAEMTVISCDELRKLAGIKSIVLPPLLDSNSMYDKWGNEILENGNRFAGPLFNTEAVQKIIKQANIMDLFIKHIKYPRTPHLPWSEKATDDDKRLGDINHFIGREVVATIKMDGENTTMYDDKIHARSLNSDNHPSRDWVKGLWSTINYQIPSDWRICGENMYALHTIPYVNLRSFFNVFSIWEKDRCLSWDETLTFTDILKLETVPVIYRGVFDQEAIHKAFPSIYDGNATEGYVIRLADGFHYDDFDKSIAKFVSKRFIINENQHWMQGKVTPNKLI